MRNSFKVILLSTLLVPAAIHANASDMAANVKTTRVSTGVVGPAIMNSKDFSVSADALNGVVVDKPAVVLALRVNEKGMAEDVRVIRSVNPKVDAQVLAAAREFRFTPATLDEEAVPVDLHLTVVVQR